MTCPTFLMVIERWYEMRFCQVLFAAIVLCFTGGCALPERGDPSLLYYRDNGSWFPEAMNDVLAEWTYDNASAATAEDFRHFLDLQGKTLRFTVQEWGTKSKKYDPHVLGSHSYFSIANVESRSAIDPTLKEFLDRNLHRCAFSVSSPGVEGWVEVDFLDLAEWVSEERDLLAVQTFDVDISTNLIERFETRSVSPVAAYPFIKDVFEGADDIPKPLVLEPIMRCSSGAFVVYSAVLKDYFYFGVPALGFDTEVFRESPRLWFRIYQYPAVNSETWGVNGSDVRMTGKELSSALWVLSHWQRLSEKLLTHGTVITGR